MYLMKYNFLTDKSAIDPSPAYIPMANGVQLTNAIFNSFDLSSNGSMSYSTTIPSEWDSSTIMQTNFNGNVNAGNVDYSTQDLAGVRIKRRIKGTFAWITLYDVAMESASGLAFTKYDLLNQHGVTYEYAFVPYLNDNTECAYIIKEVDSTLDGVFVCSPGSIAKFYGGLSYGTGSMANKTGIFEPLGSQYPVVVSNANTQYYSGSLTATAMTYNQLMNDKFDRYTTSQYLQLLMKFITDKSTKIIKDWNGNLWLAAIVDNAQVSYNNNVGMGIGDVSFNFVEIGSAQDQNTLEMNGFINAAFTPSTNIIPVYDPRPQSAVPSGMTSDESEYGVDNIRFNVDPFTGSLILFNSDALLDNANFTIDTVGGYLVFNTPDELEGVTFTLDADGNLYINT